ncbi:MAG: BrnT family toxin [Candidatus Sulfotelmatobacter sp.]
MKYEWDDAKNRKNFAKHGLSFEDAGQVFSGPCVTFEDDRFAYGEERLVTLGLLAGRLVVIAHAPRDEGTRIISMRKGNPREQKIYQKRLGAD